MINLPNGESVLINKVAKQASGSVLYKKGDAVLLATIAIDKNRNIEGDFLPLTVQYIEKSYANGKFPGGYVKREGKPSEHEILTSRLIDRSIRPLFPKYFYYPIQVTILVLSVDCELDLQVLALNATSIALFVSSVPIQKPISAVRVGLISDEFVINPSLSELKDSKIDLFISGEFENIAMIEFKSAQGELSEEKMLLAIKKAQEVINDTSKLYQEILSPHAKTALNLATENPLDSEVLGFIESKYMDKIQSCFELMSKSESGAIMSNLIDEIAIDNDLDKNKIETAINAIRRRIIRSKILNDEIRLDGRKLDEIRQITIETNILPNAHGSALFTRGETQVLAVCTIGGSNDMQSFETLQSKIPQKQNFIFHYNFPSFCTGEAYPIGSIGRRELGHGNLAKRALESSIANDDRAIRIVSEVLESNGSSSMASVCGGSLSLYATGLNPLFMVAGIAMGLIKEGKNYKILTDIMGLEDYDGDMDFKVAGNESGITALQMDIKINDINIEILRDALSRAKTARLFILEKMRLARESIVLGKNIPLFETFSVPQAKIPLIIGQGGKNIKEIIERFNVSIDIGRDNGEIRIVSTNMDDIKNARKYIESSIGADFHIGDIISGRIKKKADFGIFVELRDGIDGLIHAKSLARLNVNMGDFCEGGEIKVEIISIKSGKIELALKV